MPFYKKGSMTSNRVVTSSRLRRLFCSLFIVAAAIAALGAFGSSRASSQGSPPEQAAIATTGGGGNIVLEARVVTQRNEHRVQMRWSPADGGLVNVLRNGASAGRQPTTEQSWTTLEPTLAHSLTRSVKRTQTIARMKSPSKSRSRPIRLLKGI